MSLARRLAAWPLLLLHRLGRRPLGLRLWLLHDVTEAEMPVLEALVADLAKAGRLAGPAEAEAILDGSAPERDAVVPTFDDGFASNLAAARVVERYGARALFFVCPGLIDMDWPQQRAAIAANVFDGRRRAEDIPERMRLMKWDELRDLAGRGHAIANHTLSHRRLNRLDDDSIEAEIAGGAARLAAEMGSPGAWFAFPFGDIDSVDARVLAAAGRHHRFCRSGVRGPNGAGTHPLAVLGDHVDLAAAPAWRRLAAEGGLDSRYADARRRLAAMAG